MQSLVLCGNPKPFSTCRNTYNLHCTSIQNLVFCGNDQYAHFCVRNIHTCMQLFRPQTIWAWWVHMSYLVSGWQRMRDYLQSVSRHQTVSYVWQLKCNSSEVTDLRLVYSVLYGSRLDVSQTTHKLSYGFSISDFQVTLWYVLFPLQWQKMLYTLCKEKMLYNLL